MTMGDRQKRETTVREVLWVICNALTENTTLTDALVFAAFSGRVIIDVGPEHRIKDVKFEYTFRNLN